MQITKVGKRPIRYKRFVLKPEDMIPDDIQTIFATPCIWIDPEGWFDHNFKQLNKRLQELDLPELGRLLECDRYDLSYWRYREQLPGKLTIETESQRIADTLGFLSAHPPHSEQWYLGMLASKLASLSKAYKAGDISKVLARAVAFGGIKREYEIRFKIDKHYTKMNHSQGKRDAGLDRLNAAKSKRTQDWHVVVNRLLIRYPDSLEDSYTAAARFVLDHWPDNGIDAPKIDTIKKYIGKRFGTT